MNSNLLFNNINKLIPFSENNFNKFLKFVTEIKLKRKQIILAEGDVAQNVYFILDGCLRSYSIDKKGNEHVMQFATSNCWITDMYSFISKKKAFLFIEALKDSTVIGLKREDQLLLFEEIPALERYFRILIENSLVSNRSRIIDNFSLTASEKYNIFCKTYPDLVKEIPQKHIASFIGVSPEFLSKIKSKS